MFTKKEILIDKTVAFCLETMPYDMMDFTETGTITQSEITLRKDLSAMTVNTLLSSVKSLLRDDLYSDTVGLKTAWENVIIEMIEEESIIILGEESRVRVIRGILGETNWMIRVKHNDINFTHILVKHGDLYKLLTQSISFLLSELGEIKDIEQRASYWEIYCFLNIFDWRWKFVW